MSKLGDILRQQREKRGITLDQAAADTRIREKFIKALEDGDYMSLPGAVYTKGFLRNYAEYLDLNQDELVVLFHQERGLQAPEPARRFDPLKPITKRPFIFTPAVLVPVGVLAAVLLFVGYLYYQFTSFAVAPTLDVTEPPSDAIAQDAQFVLKGRTIPNGKVTVHVFPGPLTIADVHPANDGTFSVPLTLTTGANHVEVEVLDQSGKVSKVNRSILLQPQVAASGAPAVAVTLDEPQNGARYENSPVTIVGRADPSVQAVVVNGATVPVQSGSFQARFYFPAGGTEITVIAQNTAGASVTLKRQVSVVYTSAVVQVFVKGGDAWVQAVVDGTVVAGTGRVYKDGESATFTGRTVVVRSGNAAATQLTYNGVYQGAMGQQGQVAEKVYTAQ
jgi:cytoskeletal protein RodZ